MLSDSRRFKSQSGQILKTCNFEALEVTAMYCTFLETSNLFLFGQERSRPQLRFEYPKSLSQDTRFHYSLFTSGVYVYLAQCKRYHAQQPSFPNVKCLLELWSIMSSTLVNMKQSRTRIFTIFLKMILSHSSATSWEIPNPMLVLNLADYFKRENLIFHVPFIEKYKIHRYFKELHR